MELNQVPTIYFDACKSSKFGILTMPAVSLKICIDLLIPHFSGRRSRTPHSIEQVDDLRFFTFTNLTNFAKRSTFKNFDDFVRHLGSDAGYFGSFFVSCNGSGKKKVTSFLQEISFLNGSHAIPMLIPFFFTKIIIPQKCKLDRIFANSLSLIYVYCGLRIMHLNYYK